jgi:DNA-binding NtrC family response regulator
MDTQPPPRHLGDHDQGRAERAAAGRQCPLRVLILEDRPADAELMAAELRRHGFEFEWQRVDSEAAYAAALDPPPDVILSDYSMPGFEAPRALEIVQARRLDIPFIVVTGSINEEVAVDCMKRGASDYLLKDRLVRLGPAVAGALEQARLRRERALAAEAIRVSEERFRR